MHEYTSKYNENGELTQSARTWLSVRTTWSENYTLKLRRNHSNDVCTPTVPHRQRFPDQQRLHKERWTLPWSCEWRSNAFGSHWENSKGRTCFATKYSHAKQLNTGRVYTKSLWWSRSCCFSGQKLCDPVALVHSRRTCDAHLHVYPWIHSLIRKAMDEYNTSATGPQPFELGYSVRKDFQKSPRIRSHLSTQNVPQLKQTHGNDFSRQVNIHSMELPCVVLSKNMQQCLNGNSKATFVHAIFFVSHTTAAASVAAVVNIQDNVCTHRDLYEAP